MRNKMNIKKERLLLLIAIMLSPTLAFSQNNTSIFNSSHPSNEAGGINFPDADAKLIEPLFYKHMRDISVCLGGDGYYYLTGTNLEYKDPGVSLWKSTDLKEWESLGIVYGGERRFVAPEIHYFNANFYLALADAAGCIQVLTSESGKAIGPYTASPCLVRNATDPSLFADDDGKVYLVYGNGYIAALDADMTSLEGPVEFIKPHTSHFGDRHFPKGKAWPVQNRVGKAGAFLTKINGKYYFFANEITERMQTMTDDVFVSEASEIFGPYAPRYIALPHASQTTIFKDKQDALWATYSGSKADDYCAFRERPGVVPLEFSTLNRLRPSGKVIVENSQVSEYKPVLGSETIRDPSVTLGADGSYYMVGTNDGYGFQYPKGGVRLFRSRDLKTWSFVKFIWEWEQLGIEPPEGKFMLWAPEIKYVKKDKTFYLTFSIWSGKGVSYLFRSKTGKAEGPYENVVKANFVKGIDGFLFENDNGDLYYLWGGGNLGLLNEERNGFVREPVKLLTTENHHVGYEGNCMVKINGKYILTGAEWNGPLRTQGTYDMMYGIAENIWGPYTPARVGVPHAGHGTVFQDKKGAWWTTMFGNDRTAPWRMHFGLIPLQIGDDLEIKAMPKQN
ncbi:family 43 glycosylhydrolase [Fulvivirgaceae bacterium BMA12]|uniref:Family 43 glycosylhydrolase n=1 Tax=Agaribacillus aureus TaxID=3051825 RepID=A0ABT8L131_9BACT|nr:family 43 glycosylhydrolase [Fulvivirgaceae bacterium BMA12]